MATKSSFIVVISMDYGSMQRDKRLREYTCVYMCICVGGWVGGSYLETRFYGYRNGMHSGYIAFYNIDTQLLHLVV